VKLYQAYRNKTTGVIVKIVNTKNKDNEYTARNIYTDECYLIEQDKSSDWEPLDKPVAVATIEVPITAYMIDNILCTALEGGSNYWLHTVYEVKTPDVDELEGYDEELYKKVHFLPMQKLTQKLLRGAHYEFRDYDGDYKKDRDAYTLTKEKMINGIQIALRKPFEDSHHKVINLDDYDAADADLILQYALFGKIIYA
jgi:hypothetical protein